MNSFKFCSQVTGVVVDKEGTPKWVLQGTWDNKIEAAKVIKSHGSAKGKPILETATSKTLWKRVHPPYVPKTHFSLRYLILIL